MELLEEEVQWVQDNCNRMAKHLMKKEPEKAAIFIRVSERLKERDYSVDETELAMLYALTTNVVSTLDGVIRDYARKKEKTRELKAWRRRQMLAELRDKFMKEM